MTVRRLTAAALLFLSAAAPASAQPLSGRGSDRGPGKLLVPFQPVVARVDGSTVRVVCDEKEAALGTVVFADGYVLTKASELRGTVAVRLTDGTSLDAEVVSVHKPTDLALLKIEAKDLKPVEFKDSKKVPIGNWLAAAGTTSDPVAVGIVSVMTRNLTGPDAEFTLNNNRGYLGVELDDETDGGAKITRVVDGGAAAKAGLKKSDVIVEVNGQEIPGHQALRDLLETYRPGEKVTVKVRRKDGEVVEMRITLTGPNGPKNRSDIQNSMGGELSGRRTGFPSVLQTDMVVDPKNCGGPVVDLDGNVLGITIARAGRVETWVLPSETIRPLLTDMKAGKYPPVSVRKTSKS